MENKKYKILVLSDLRGTTENILKNTAALAQMIGGEIGLLHIKSPLMVVQQYNQLSAVRSINDTYLTTKKQIQNLVEPISRSYGVSIQPDFAVGNVKEVLSNHISTFQPDIIVLGQRKSAPISILGDRITKYVMSHFDGIVMIASPNQALEAVDNLSLGMINGSPKSLETDLLKALVSRTSKPIKSFKIAQGNKRSEQQRAESNQRVVEYNFEQRDNAVGTVSRYLSKVKVDVLFMDLENHSHNGINVKNAIGKFNVPVLLASKSKLSWKTL